MISRELSLYALNQKNEELQQVRAAFIEFIELVDECLLLDEELDQAWEQLHQGVNLSRKMLEDLRRGQLEAIISEKLKSDF